MKNAHKDNINKLIFLSMDSIYYKISSEFIIKTILNKINKEQNFYKIFVSFIIEQDNYDLFNLFYNGINLLNKSKSLNQISKTIDNSQIYIELGDIIQQKVDVIAISSSSDILKQLIIIEAGEEVYQMYERENKKNPNNLLIICPSGNLSCKKIFFIKWNPNENEIILKQSIIDFIHNLIQNIITNQYKSVALPPIGCNHKNLSTSFIIKTFINQFIYQIKSRNLSLIIKFIILPDQYEIYQEFYQELLQSEQQGYLFLILYLI